MDISSKKNRTDLKGYFVKNAIPTQANFSDFIDGMIIQKDDGLARPAGEPISIEASTAGALPALKIYEHFTDAAPAWTFSLVSDTNKGTKGLVISDGTSQKARLTIDRTSGDVSMATLSPTGLLTAGGGMTVPAGQLLSVAGTLTTTGPLNANGGLTVPAGQTLSLSGTLSCSGAMILNDKTITFRPAGDLNHGLGWYGPVGGEGPAKPFGSATPDGPILFGWNGGGLGTTNGGQKVALSWDATGNVTITGVPLWGESLVRTEYRDDAGLPTVSGARSGFYQTAHPVNFPTTAANVNDWWHLIDCHHTNINNNFAMQICGFFRDQSLWYRKMNGSTTAAWTLVATAGASDVVLKRDISPLGDVLGKVLSLRGVSFSWIDESRGADREIGVIAQEVEKVFPELVYEAGGNRYVRYDKFVAVLIEAVKSLAAEVDTLKQARPA